MGSFYRELYTAEQVDIPTQNQILNLVKNKLTSIQQSFCEGAITKAELETAVKALNTDKSPGTDGLPAEFYRSFWGVLGGDLTDVFNDSYQNKLLPYSQREAVLKCLPKKGDLTKITNWRLVSLLNTDYEILTRVLAERLGKVLPLIVSEDQTCNVRGRTIHHNTALIRDIIDYANDTDIPASLISVDQMKAFDRVDWEFMFKTLQQFNLGPIFINWVRLIYKDISSKAKVNGKLSDSFVLQHGIRQGCPLSAMLYVQTAEILAECIKQNPQIKGISVNGTSCLLSQYADDTTHFLQWDESFAALKQSLQLYKAASGARVHPAKCEGLWLGSNRGREDSPNGYRWTNESLKLLGLYFGNGNQHQLNWQSSSEFH